MSNIMKQVILLPCRTPLTQFQRFRGKINIQRPQQPHYERARVVAVTQPILPAPVKTLNCYVPKHSALNAANPYRDIISREVRNWFQHSRMVGFFHMNSIGADEAFDARVQFHKQDMQMKVYGKATIERAVKNTRFEAILPLFDSKMCIIFSTQQRAPQMLRIARKVPQMLLLAAIVDEQLLSRNEFMDYAKLPGLQAAQAELAQTLNMAANNLVQQLETHQKNFVNVLDVYAKNEDATTTSTNEAASTAPPKASD